MEKYIPDIYTKSIYTIDYVKLKNIGITHLLFDLDNTLCPIKMKEPNKKLKELFKDLKENGFTCFIFSNASKKRVSAYSDILEVKGYHKMKKPLKKGFTNFIIENALQETNVAIIGDQMLTDIKGGNEIGIMTILVNPVSKKDSLITTFTRKIEKRVMKKLRDNNLFSKGRYYDKM